MVDVAMCIDEPHGFQFIGCDEIVQFQFFTVFIAPRINYNALFGVIIEDIGVFLKGAESEDS